MVATLEMQEEVWHDYGLVLWHVGRHMEASRQRPNLIVDGWRSNNQVWQVCVKTPCCRVLQEHGAGVFSNLAA